METGPHGVQQRSAISRRLPVRNYEDSLVTCFTTEDSGGLSQDSHSRTTSLMMTTAFHFTRRFSTAARYLLAPCTSKNSVRSTGLAA